MDPFFTKINKLRFLQANKFKVEKAIESMEENTKWRKKEFPIHSDPKTEKLLVKSMRYRHQEPSIFVGGIASTDPYL